MHLRRWQRWRLGVWHGAHCRDSCLPVGGHIAGHHGRGSRRRLNSRHVHRFLDLHVFPMILVTVTLTTTCQSMSAKSASISDESKYSPLSIFRHFDYPPLSLFSIKTIGTDCRPFNSSEFTASFVYPPPAIILQLV